MCQLLLKIYKLEFLYYKIYVKNHTKRDAYTSSLFVCGASSRILVRFATESLPVRFAHQMTYEPSVFVQPCKHITNKRP